MPKFSIITPCYNSWQFMDKYLRSLEQQTYQDFEVIIVDDCSKDDTYVQLKDYAMDSHLNIRVLRNDKNYGPGYTRNRGKNEATGEWITFVDSDDSVDTHLFEKAVNIVSISDKETNPINCIVYDYCIVRGNKIALASSMYGNRRGGYNRYQSASRKCEIM